MNGVLLIAWCKTANVSPRAKRAAKFSCRTAGNRSTKSPVSRGYACNAGTPSTARASVNQRLRSSVDVSNGLPFNSSVYVPKRTWFCQTVSRAINFGEAGDFRFLREVSCCIWAADRRGWANLSIRLSHWAWYSGYRRAGRNEAGVLFGLGAREYRHCIYMCRCEGQGFRTLLVWSGTIGHNKSGLRTRRALVENRVPKYRTMVSRGTGRVGGGGGGGEVSYEKVGNARRKFSFWPLRGNDGGVVQACFRPWKVPKTAAYGLGNASFITSPRGAVVFQKTWRTKTLPPC